MRSSIGIISFALLASFSATAQQYNISTIAGGSPLPTPVAALSAPIASPGAVASDAAGDVYFVSDDCVFEISTSGNLTRIAGNSRVGFAGDGGAATSAQLNMPGGLALDAAGNLYIADSGNSRIRKVVLSSGIINTIAGTGVAGSVGNSGPASGAELNNPQGLAVDLNNNLYIADAGNHAIRMIAFSTGNLTTVAGTLGLPGNSGDGSPATVAQLNTPMGVAVDTALNIYISDSNNFKIREVQSGIISTIAGNGLAGYTGDGGQAKVAELNLPTAIAVNAAFQIYFTDFNNQRVRTIVPGGNISTVTGGTGSPVAVPTGIALDSNSNLYVADSSSGHLLRYSLSGSITIIAGTGVPYYLGDNGPAMSAQLVQPQGLAVDTSNALYVADRGEARIRKIAGGTINSPAGATGLGPSAVAVSAAGNIYVADTAGNKVFQVTQPGGVQTPIAGNGTGGYNGDGILATSAAVNQPAGIAVDSAGNVYIADTANNRVRKVTATSGLISTIAGNGTAGYTGDGQLATNAQVNQPTGLAVDSAGDVFIVDTGNYRVRKITATTGTISTVAGNGSNTSTGDGGSATAASIATPHGVALDTLGNLYITDFSGRVRKVSVGGTITTIAGNGTSGYGGDGGPATSAQLSMPWGIALDSSNNVYVSDVAEQAIRELTPIAAPALSITTPSPLPSGTVGSPYAQTLLATGGTPPYSWTNTVGSLPPGLTLSPTGSVSGTPTASGTFLVTFQVTDSGSLTATATIEFIISGSSPAGLNITSPANLVPGAVNFTYSQTLAATSGNPPYTWSLVSGALPAGLTLFPSGLISGTPSAAGTSTFVVRVTDNSGNVASQTFALNVISAGTLNLSGAFGHIAVGGTWTTEAYLTNVSGGAVAVTLNLFGDSGSQLTVPLSITQQGATQTFNTNTVSFVLSPNTTVILNSGAQIPTTLTGWIQVLSSGAANSLAGFSIFTTSEASGAPPSAGTAPLQTQFLSTLDVPYDDTGAFVTGVGIANLSPSATTVTATVLDINGNQLGSYALQLPAMGHTSFLFPSQFAVSANQVGLVQFLSTNGGGLAGVGLRATTTTGTFTSVPVIVP